MKATMEHIHSPEVFRGRRVNSSSSSAAESGPQNTKDLTPFQKSSATAIVSPNEKQEMIDYPTLSLERTVVPSDSVEFFLVLAKKFTSKGMLPKALEFYARALRIVNKDAGTNEDDRLLVADILFEIGLIHLDLKDPLKALVVFDHCQNIRRQQLDWDDERNAMVLQEQARIYNVIGDSESAVKVLEELLGILCCKGKDARVLRASWLELARHQQLLGLYTEAASSREEAEQL